MRLKGCQPTIKITEGYPFLAKLDRPEGPNINPIGSHMMTNMWMEENNGYGKMKILPIPMGQLVKTMLESGVKLGVRPWSRVKLMSPVMYLGFEIITVDVVAQPATGAYPTPIYEHLMNAPEGTRLTN